MGLVGVLENAFAELLHLPDDVPTLVVADCLENISHQPVEQLVFFAQLLNHRVDSQLLHLLVVEFNTEVRGQVKFAGKVLQHTLKEFVNGLHTKRTIVVDKALQCECGILLHQQWVDTQFARHLVHIALRIGIAMGQAIELAQDACFHLFRGLVGESDRKDMPKTRGVGYQQFDVFHSQRECLAAASAGLVDFQWGHRNGVLV